MLKTKNYKLKTDAGFTLLETIIAIAILSMAILGPLELASRTIGSAVVSQNQITAFYLAQEGIEYVRNVRDNNFLDPSNPPWLDGLNNCFGADGCVVDVPNYDQNNPSDSSAACVGECPNLKYDGDTGYFYNHAYGDDTIFRRTVKITENIGENPNEANVESVVYWKGKFKGKSVVLQENIFNWK